MNFYRNNEWITLNGINTIYIKDFIIHLRPQKKGVFYLQLTKQTLIHQHNNNKVYHGKN